MDLGFVVEDLAVSGPVRRRYATPIFVQGKASTPSYTDTPFDAVLAPVQSRVLERVDPGLRARARYQVTTTAELRTADRAGGLIPDDVVLNGEIFQVVAIDDWTPQGSGFRVLVLLERRA